MISYYLFILSYIFLRTHAGLSAEYANEAFSNEEYIQHTFEVWANPSKFVSQEQSILQTGVIGNPKLGGSWAIEFKLKVTIWQQGHDKPSGSVLYIDMWNQSAAEDGSLVWSKTRYYVILGGENYPWVHITFTAPNNLGSGASLLINGKQRRMDKYSSVSSDAQPRPSFAIGEQFHGAIDEVRIWKAQPTTDIHSPLCPADINLCRQVLTLLFLANTVLYVPFDECRGDVFVGYKQDSTVCAVMYGEHGDTSLVAIDDEAGIQFNPIWTNGSPVATRTCALANEEQCSNATQIAPAVSAANEDAEKAGVQIPSWVMGLKDKVLYVPIAVLLLAFLVHTLKNRRVEQQQQQLTDALC